MAPQPKLSLLFHPKKNAKKEILPPPTRNVTTSRPKSTPVKDEEDDGLKLPEGNFQEFRLLSSALNGWKYDVMKFDSRKPVDISKWQAPIKLNRKDLRRDEGAVSSVPEPVGPMLGPDGKPVIGADGKMVMVDVDGRPIHASDGASSSKDKAKAPANGKKRFQKKTKQVYFVPEEVRQLRKEERYPWVMEDSSPSHNELWIGQMEDVIKSETHAFFMPAANDVFKFVPAHRWYKFQKKLKHDLPTDTANVESLYNLNQKRDPQAWLANRNGKGPSAATAAMFKAESEGRTLSGGSSLVYSTSQSLGPGGRKLKTVDSGMDGLFDDDEDGDSKRRREKEFGGEGDLDEQEYEDDFADDEEKVEADDNDEEAKEIEERLKREYKSANKQRDTGIDDESEDDSPGTSKQEKAMQKLIRNREGNDAYESDEEKNPYATSEEEEEEEAEVPVPPAVPPQSQPPTSESRPQTPKLPIPRPQANGSGSRAVSPAASPGLGGHSIVAKRATSPKVPKTKPSASRGNSPLGSRATSPASGSRATSPSILNRPEHSPAAVNGAQKANKKRKAEDSSTAVSSSNNQPPAAKKRKETISPVALEAELIEWLKTASNPKTKECIRHFSAYMPEMKQEFLDIIKKVAILKGGLLVLKSKGSAVSSPAPSTGT